MERAKISRKIAGELGMPEAMRRLAGKEVCIYPETLGCSNDPKTIGIIPCDADLPDPKTLNPEMMICVAVEFVEMDNDKKKYLGLV